MQSIYEIWIRGFFKPGSVSATMVIASQLRKHSLNLININIIKLKEILGKPQKGKFLVDRSLRAGRGKSLATKKK